MRQWFTNLFSKKKQTPCEYAIHTKTIEDCSTPEPQGLEPEIVSMIRDAAQEAANARAKLEQEFFTDEKLKSSFKKAMIYVISRLDETNYNFVLVHDNDISVPKNLFSFFGKFFIKACGELNIQAEISDPSYIRVDKAGVRKLIENLPTAPLKIDMDEKVRALLRTGIYR